jgi:hypothetical protein
VTRPRRTGTTCHLRLAQPASQAVDELLAALDQWAQHARRTGAPVAYLEAGDAEIRGEFPLTAAKIAELTALLRGAARGRGAG